MSPPQPHTHTHTYLSAMQTHRYARSVSGELHIITAYLSVSLTLALIHSHRQAHERTHQVSGIPSRGASVRRSSISPAGRWSADGAGESRLQWRPGSSSVSPPLSPFLLAHTCSLRSPPSRARVSALAQIQPSSISILLYRSSRYYQLQSRGQRWQILSTDLLICHLLGCLLSSTPPPSSPLPVSLSACFLIFACHFFPLPPSIDPLCAKREREGGRVR